MRKVLLVAFTVLFSGCVGGTNMNLGAGIYENFCGSADYAVLEEKGSRLYSMLSDPEVVIAVRDEITGSMTVLGAGGDYTYDYLPDEESEDDYLIFIDRKALEKSGEYCDYAITLNKRTNDFFIMNTTRMQLLD